MSDTGDHLQLCPACGADLRVPREREAPCSGASDHESALTTWPWERSHIAATRRVFPPATTGAWRLPFLARWVRESPFHVGLVWLGVCLFHWRLHDGPTTTTWILAACGAASVAGLAWLIASTPEYVAPNGAIAWVLGGRALFAEGPTREIEERTLEGLEAGPELLATLQTIRPSDVHRACRRHEPPHRLGTNALEASLVFALLSALAMGRVRLLEQRPSVWRRRFGVRTRRPTGTNRTVYAGIALWVEPTASGGAEANGPGAGDPLLDALLAGLWETEATVDAQADGYRQPATQERVQGAPVRVRVSELLRAVVPVDLPAGRWAQTLTSSASTTTQNPDELFRQIKRLTLHHKTAAVMWLLLNEVREGVAGLRARARENGFGRPVRERRSSSGR